MNVELLEEPDLIFGGGAQDIDPRVGLLANGPAGHDLDSDGTLRITAAAIGPRKGVSRLKSYLSQLRHSISAGHDADDKPWRIDFPGLGPKGPLPLNIDLQPAGIEVFDDTRLRAVLAIESRQRRVQELVNLYEQRINDLVSTDPSPPSIIYFPLTRRLLDECKDPEIDGDRISFSRTPDSSLPRGYQTPVFDFHHVLKVLTARHRIPCQLIRPSTLRLEPSGDDPATMAWNFSTATYYKATGTPWKVSNLDPGTCLVGISFYVQVDGDESALGTSMAHVHMKTAESQVIRGSAIPLGGGKNTDSHLDRETAADLLQDVLDLYDRQLQRVPNRVVVHKTRPFDNEEMEGFESVTDEASLLDLVHIKTRKLPRFFHDGYKYPPVRGTLIKMEEEGRSFLYTAGFVPALDTYPGVWSPRPLEIVPYHLGSSIREMAEDIMAMTKLDWNTSNFYTREPVTTSVSSKVGSILAEMEHRDVKDIPKQYRFYM